MPSVLTLCNKSVGNKITCPYCSNVATKHGKTKTGIQRYRCKEETCRRTFLLQYSNQACLPHINCDIKSLLKEGCGIRSTGRLLQISNTTVIKRILAIAKSIPKPATALNKSYEVDELCTYCKNKSKLLWVVYAIEKTTGEVADFAVGSRTKGTLNKVVSTLLMSQPKTICTDKLPLYTFLIPERIHHDARYGTNRIERKNLNPPHASETAEPKNPLLQQKHSDAVCLPENLFLELRKIGEW